MHVWEQGVYRKSLYLTLKIIVNLKVLLKNLSLNLFSEHKTKTNKTKNLCISQKYSSSQSIDIYFEKPFLYFLGKVLLQHVLLYCICLYPALPSETLALSRLCFLIAHRVIKSITSLVCFKIVSDFL